VRATVIAGDCVEVMRGMEAESVDAVVCDPPAGIAFMGKEWDDAKGWEYPITNFGFTDGGVRLPAPTIGRSSVNPTCRACGKRARTWADGPPACACAAPDFDAGARHIEARAKFVAFLTVAMRECLRVLKPGGHAVVWALPRTSHWTTWAIEDAGFEIREVVTHLFGSGFPKSLSVSKALDAAVGAKREVSGTDAAKQWDGWGTALKPAAEHWIIARKPLIGTVAANVTRFGTGALNIDGCRVMDSTPSCIEGSPAGGYRLRAPQSDPRNRKGVVGTDLGISGASVEKFQQAQRESIERTNTLGRWPANLVLSHTPECRKVGTRKVTSGVAVQRNGGRQKIGNVVYNGTNAVRVHPDATYADKTGEEEIEAWECDQSCPVAALDRQSGPRTSGVMTGMQRGWGKHGIYGASGDTPATCYGDTGGASRFFNTFSPDDDPNDPLAKMDAPFFYTAKASRKEREAGCTGNAHPTVKPIVLMRHLVRLVTPPGGVVLDPFMGSGTTGIACLYEGVRFVGIEREAEYMTIARARLAHHAALTK
jgi:site-specific DNA-methyltransferase (adenine-specific)